MSNGQAPQAVKCPRCTDGKIPIQWKVFYCAYCSNWTQVATCAAPECQLTLCHPCLSKAIDPNAPKPEYKPGTEGGSSI